MVFFQSIGAHRDLHSFPTRRSSDLDHTQETNPSGVDPDQGLGAWTRYDSHPATVWISRGETYMGTSAGLVLDRKSTRLNSSHGYTSYAVFRLKKKKRALLRPGARLP